MEPYRCKICDSKVEENNHFYKKHKITIKNYFEIHEQKKDLFDNSIIEFKGNMDDYFSKLFNSRVNMGKWLKSVSKEEQQKYIINFLLERKNRKNLIYSPTQVELKSLLLPGIKWINENFKDYYLLCKELGFENRFNIYKLNKTLFKDVSRKVIFKDSREQLPLEFNNNIVKTDNLNIADYRMAGCDILIERKSMGDFFGTLSGGFERFCKEIIRSQEQNKYLIVLIEEPFNNIYRFPKLPHLRYKKLPSSEFILYNTRLLLEQNKNLQFLFVKNREESSRIIEFIFSADNLIKDIDLQLAYDMEELINETL